MKELWRTENPTIQSLVGRLVLACAKPIPQTPWLDQFAPDGNPVPLDNDTHRAAAAALGVALPIPVALPPEPSAPVALPMPVAPLTALPLPAEYVPSAAPVASAASVLTFDLPDDDTPTRKKRQPKEPEQSQTRLYLILGGVLLLVGAGIAGVMMMGGKKPNGTAQGEDQKDPGHKEPDGKGKSPPKQKEKDPDPIQPKPKEKDPDPLPPITPTPAGISIKERQRITLEGVSPAIAHFASDSRSLIVLSNTLRLYAFDTQTGATRELPQQKALVFPVVIPLSGERIATWSRGEKSLTITDLATGRSDATLALPELPPVVERDNAVIHVSPDGRYVSYGRRSVLGVKPGTTEKGFIPVPFRLLDTKTGKELLSFDWQSGSVHFNADASRVLIVEGSGKGRWFKLPSGEADGEWKYGEQPAGRPLPFNVEAATSDARLLLCFGLIEGKGFGHVLLDGNTGRVSTVLGPGFSQNSGSLSADGQLVALMQIKPGTREGQLVVFDVARGTEVARINLPEGDAPFYRTLLSPDGRTAAVVDRGQRRFVVAYDVVSTAGTPIAKTPDPKPIGKLQVKDGWTLDIGSDTTLAKVRSIAEIQFDLSANLVYLNCQSNGLLAFDLKSGDERTVPATLKSGIVGCFPLDGNRVGTLASKAAEIAIWDVKSWKETGRIPIPEIPAGVGEAIHAKAFLSPNGKYLAVGRSGLPRATYPDGPLRVFDTTTNKEVLSLDWKGGTIHFTSDSSRVLVAEWAGRFRWFKLPSGEADGGWELPAPVAPRRHDAFDISADGSVIAYNGPGDKKVNGMWPGVIDGKTGAITQQFKTAHYASRVSISDDGRRAAMILEIKEGGCTLGVVDAKSGTSLAKVRVESGQSSPNFALTPDGKALLVHDYNTKKLCLFGLPEPKSPVSSRVDQLYRSRVPGCQGAKIAKVANFFGSPPPEPFRAVSD